MTRFLTVISVTFYNLDTDGTVTSSDGSCVTFVNCTFDRHDLTPVLHHSDSDVFLRDTTVFNNTGAAAIVLSNSTFTLVSSNVTRNSIGGVQCSTSSRVDIDSSSFICGNAPEFQVSNCTVTGPGLLCGTIAGVTGAALDGNRIGCNSSITIFGAKTADWIMTPSDYIANVTMGHFTVVATNLNATTLFAATQSRVISENGFIIVTSRTGRVSMSILQYLFDGTTSDDCTFTVVSHPQPEVVQIEYGGRTRSVSVSVNIGCQYSYWGRCVIGDVHTQWSGVNDGVLICNVNPYPVGIFNFSVEILSGSGIVLANTTEPLIFEVYVMPSILHVTPSVAHRDMTSLVVCGTGIWEREWTDPWCRFDYDGAVSDSRGTFYNTTCIECLFTFDYSDVFNCSKGVTPNMSISLLPPDFSASVRMVTEVCVPQPLDAFPSVLRAMSRTVNTTMVISRNLYDSDHLTCKYTDTVTNDTYIVHPTLPYEFGAMCPLPIVNDAAVLVLSLSNDGQVFADLTRTNISFVSPTRCDAGQTYDVNLDTCVPCDIGMYQD